MYINSFRLLISSMILCLIAVSFMLIINTKEALIPGAIGYGLSMSVAYPSAIALPTRLNFHITATETSWYSIGVSLGTMVIPYIVGLFFDKHNSVILYAILSCLGLSFILLLSLWIYLKVYPPQFEYKKLGQEDEDKSPYDHSNEIMLQEIVTISVSDESKQ